MESFCDSTKNFIPGKPYSQISLNSSITEEEARKQCMEHTMKSGAHEGKDFFFQQHGNGYTICGFYNDKINDGDVKQSHGHTFGGICTIPKNADVLLLVNEKLEPLKNSILENKNKLNLVKLKSETNSSGVQSLTSQVNELENIATTLQTADNNMIKSMVETMTTRLNELENITGDLKTSDDNMVANMKDLAEKTNPVKCQRRKGFIGSNGPIKNFRKNGSEGLESGMTLEDCVRIGKRNGWNFVGHRNNDAHLPQYKNTCWRHDSDFRQNENLEKWIRTDGKEGSNITIELKENCSL